jgi:hypothetical protein
MGNSQVKYDTFEDCVKACRKDINNLSNVPFKFATMELIKELDMKEIERVICFKQLANFTPDVQNLFLDKWMANRTYDQLMNLIPLTERDAKNTALTQKMLDRVFTEQHFPNDYCSYSEKFKKLLEENLNYVLTKIKNKNLRIPMIILNDIQLTADQLEMLFGNRQYILLTDESPNDLYPTFEERKDTEKSAIIIKPEELTLKLLLSNNKIYKSFVPSRADRFLITDSGIIHTKSMTNEYFMTPEQYIQYLIENKLPDFKDDNLRNALVNYQVLVTSGKLSNMPFIEYVKLAGFPSQASFNYLKTYR